MAAADLYHDDRGYLLEDATITAGGVEPAGVSMTAQKNLPTGLLANLQTSVRKMLDGKAELSFVPSALTRFLSVNPDEIVKIIPFTHYFSYLFDLTSRLPIKNGSPEDPIIAPFTYLRRGDGSPASSARMIR